MPAIQPEPFMYSRKRETEQLEKIIATIAEIDECFKLDDFPAESQSCGSCGFWRNCSGYSKWQEDKRAREHEVLQIRADSSAVSVAPISEALSELQLASESAAE
jgi:hypothetical protein